MFYLIKMSTFTTRMWIISHTAQTFQLFKSSFVKLPVCSAVDQYDSNGHGEHWQQLALASSRSLRVLPWSYSHFSWLSTEMIETDDMALLHDSSRSEL